MYRTICTELWTDPKVKQLNVNGRLLFLYLITNPYTHLSGIYSLPLSTLQHQTGLTDRVSREALDTLSNYGLAHWDHEREIAWVVNMFEYQGQGPKNEQAAANHLQTLHHSPLCERFLERYPKVTEYIKKPARIERESLPPSVRFAVLNRDLFTCQYCGATGKNVRLEIDHVVPVKDGGTDDLTNLTTACLTCNQGKGTDRVSDLEKRCPSVPNPVPDSDLSPDSAKKIPKKGNGKRPISDDDKPTEKHYALGDQLGVNVGPEWGKFKNYCLAHDKRYADFEAAFRNWIANAPNMKGGAHAVR